MPENKLQLMLISGSNVLSPFLHSQFRFLCSFVEISLAYFRESDLIIKDS